MRYQVRVAGRIFEGSDVSVLLKCAVEARKEAIRGEGDGMNSKSFDSGQLGPRLVRNREEMTAA